MQIINIHQEGIEDLRRLNFLFSKPFTLMISDESTIKEMKNAVHDSAIKEAEKLNCDAIAFTESCQTTSVSFNGVVHELKLLSLMAHFYVRD